MQYTVSQSRSNGARIINKAGGRDGKSLRGYSVDLLIIDEADFIPNPVFVAGEQCTASVRGKIWLISTPNRKASTFYKYFHDGLEARKKYNNPELLETDEEPYEEPIGRDLIINHIMYIGQRVLKHLNQMVVHN